MTSKSAGGQQLMGGGKDEFESQSGKKGKRLNL